MTRKYGGKCVAQKSTYEDYHRKLLVRKKLASWVPRRYSVGAVAACEKAGIP